MLWIPFTLMAAFMQAWRNAYQKQLSQHVSVTGVTFARFIWAGPLAAIYLFLLYQIKPVDLPTYTVELFVFIGGAAVFQILATALMVKLFTLRNYAVGVGLAKSEAILAAILGAVFFSQTLSVLAWVGVVIGAFAVFLLSGAKFKSLSIPTLMFGLGSGLAFALTSLWVREASLVLNLPFPHGAAWILLWVIAIQTLILAVWIGIKQPHTLVMLMRHGGLTFKVSLTSCIGSIGWFTAMSLASVALVKTLGQIEVLFSLIISVFVLKEKLTRADKSGLVVILAAALCVVWP